MHMGALDEVSRPTVSVPFLMMVGVAETAGAAACICLPRASAMDGELRLASIAGQEV